MPNFISCIGTSHPIFIHVKFSMQLRSCVSLSCSGAAQLAICTKIFKNLTENFGILPYVKSLDKIKILWYNIIRKNKEGEIQMTKKNITDELRNSFVTDLM